MGDYENFYTGADYGLDPNHGDNFLNFSYRFPAAQFSLTTDPRSANQLSEVSKKISTGVKGIEITGITPQILESVPEQHLTEINRLKKLTGVNLTFHGPLVEPTGINPQSRNWSEHERAEAERQIWSAVDRSHKLDPDGNIVVTLHSSNGLPEPLTKVKDEKGKIIETSLAVINERTGQFGPLPPPAEDYFNKEPKDVYKNLNKINTENWQKSLGNLSFVVRRGREALDWAEDFEKKAETTGITQKDILNIYKQSKTEGGQKFLDTLPEKAKDVARSMINNIDFGSTHIKEAYTDLQELYNQAYDVASPEDRKKLDHYSSDVAKKMKGWKDNLDKDPEKLVELADEVTNGVRILNSITAPQSWKPLREFGIEKSGQTFGNVAFQGYKKFRDTAPIISIENPPAGMGLSKAEDLKEVVEKARDSFVQKAKKELGMSESHARKQAEKLIGVTWDVGHINMIRKYGFEEKDVVKQTETIAPFVKHVHLSDNFGMEHTELPMGMGNVPTKKMLDLISQYNKQAKKVIETGGPWYQFFQRSPLRETFQAFGSPIYAMEAGPYWNQTPAMTAGYGSGFGNVLPDVNFSTYGAGFATLPTSLGGQIPGTRSRVSGAPME